MSLDARAAARRRPARRAARSRRSPTTRFLSDCETTALVAPERQRRVAVPAAHRLPERVRRDPRPRRRRVPARPGRHARCPAARRYLPGTMVLETSWGTPAGWIIVRDVLLDRAVAPPGRALAAPTAARRPTTTPSTCCCAPSAASTARSSSRSTASRCSTTAASGATWEYTGRRLPRGRRRGRGRATCELRLTTDLRLGFEGPRATARTLLKEGDTRFCRAVLERRTPPPHTYDEAYRRLVWTAHHWQHWLARGEFPDHPWRAYLQRSALTLKGLTYAPTGALVAAATTSLPETPGGERNWDYRYSWIRDSTFALWGLYTLGFDWEANDFFYFIADVAERDDDLQIMYGVGGERDLDRGDARPPRRATRARGPVRIGNGAYDQRQHDVWGAVLDSVYLHTKSRDRLDDRVWPMLKRQVEDALEHWREPDRGIWEVRGEPKHFTSSKVMCWVALDRGARLARLREDTRARDALAGRRPTRSTPTSARTASTSAACSPSTTAPTRSTPRAAHPAGALPARPTTRGCAATVLGDRRRADRRRPRAALPGRGDRRRPAPARRARSRSARSGWSRRWPRSASIERARRPVREAALLRQPARPLRGGDRPAHRAATSATSRRRSPTWR